MGGGLCQEPVVPVQDGVGDLARVVSQEGRAPDEELVEGRAEGEHVRPRVGLFLLLPDLRSHVEDRPQDLARLSQARAKQVLGQPEVHDLGRPLGRHDRVGGLDVAVQEAQRMNSAEPEGHVSGDLGGSTRREGTLAEQDVEGLSRDVLRDERGSLAVVDLVDAHQVRVRAELAQRLPLTQEARPGLGVPRQPWRQELEDDRLAARPPREVDGAARAPAQESLDSTAGEHRADLEA